MNLAGRRKIYSSTQVINESNIIDEVNKALTKHMVNVTEETYLYGYRKGITPILNRTKEVRPEINNKIVENLPEVIVTFKDGYFLTEPCFYTPRKAEFTEQVQELNEYLYRSGKHSADNRIVDDFHTVGIGVLYVEPKKDKKCPCKAYSLDPRSAFVVYSLKPGNEPVLGVYVAKMNGNLIVNAFTEDTVYHLVGYSNKSDDKKVEVPSKVSSIESIEPNLLAPYIPIIEYRYNSTSMSAYEAAIPLIDSINNIESNRVDSIEQFVQSLMVAVNVDFEEGVTANEIMQSGLLCLKSVGENKADIEILSETLNQSETQVLIDYMYKQVLTICGVPDTSSGGASTSDTGYAVYLRDGWATASTYALNTEDLFKESNAYFDKIFLKILDIECGFNGIDEGDFELHFIRNEASNVQTKAQALSTLLSAGVAPELAFSWVGLSRDVTNDIEKSKPYLEMMWGNPNDKTPTETEEVVLEEVVDEPITI